MARARPCAATRGAARRARCPRRAARESHHLLDRRRRREGREPCARAARRARPPHRAAAPRARSRSASGRARAISSGSPGRSARSDRRPACATPSRPSSPAIGRSASITTRMCSSRSTPSSSCALDHVLAIDARCEALLLELLAHRPRLERREALGSHERACVHEAGELVAGEEHVLEVALARRRVLQVARVREDRAHEPVGVAELAQDTARRPADADRASGGARSRSRAAAPRSPTRPRRRRAAARRREQRPRPRRRGGAAPRSSSTRAAVASAASRSRASFSESWASASMRRTVADGRLTACPMESRSPGTDTRPGALPGPTGRRSLLDPWLDGPDGPGGTARRRCRPT